MENTSDGNHQQQQQQQQQTLQPANGQIQVQSFMKTVLVQLDSIQSRLNVLSHTQKEIIARQELIERKIDTVESRIEAIQTVSDPAGSLSSNSVNQSNNSQTPTTVAVPSSTNGPVQTPTTQPSGMNLLLDAVNQQQQQQQQHNLATQQNTAVTQQNEPIRPPQIQPPQIQASLPNGTVMNNQHRFLLAMTPQHKLFAESETIKRRKIASGMSEYVLASPSLNLVSQPVRHKSSEPVPSVIQHRLVNAPPKLENLAAYPAQTPTPQTTPLPQLSDSMQVFTQTSTSMLPRAPIDVSELTDQFTNVKRHMAEIQQLVTEHIELKHPNCKFIPDFSTKKSIWELNRLSKKNPHVSLMKKMLQELPEDKWPTDQVRGFVEGSIKKSEMPNPQVTILMDLLIQFYYCYRQALQKSTYFQDDQDLQLSNEEFTKIMITSFAIRNRQPQTQAKLARKQEGDMLRNEILKQIQMNSVNAENYSTQVQLLHNLQSTTTRDEILKNLEKQVRNANAEGLLPKLNAINGITSNGIIVVNGNVHSGLVTSGTSPSQEDDDDDESEILDIEEKPSNDMVTDNDMRVESQNLMLVRNIEHEMSSQGVKVEIKND